MTRYRVYELFAKHYSWSYEYVRTFTNFQMAFRLKLLCERLAYENWVPPSPTSGGAPANTNTSMVADAETGGKRPATLMDLFPVNQGRGQR